MDPALKQLHRWGGAALLWTLVWSASPALAADLRVAVAANFASTFQSIAAAFERSTGYSVNSVVGSTGLLYAQVKHGAPFDALLAADEQRPARLVTEGLAVASSNRTYAVGRLVLWVPAEGPPIELADLTGPGFARIAMANPKLAPYGVAARSVLNAAGLEQQLSGQLVLGENVAGVYSLVASGNAQAGFVALSQMKTAAIPEGQYRELPREQYPPIRQNMVITRHGESNPTAWRLLDFMTSATGRAVIENAGYRLPPEAGGSHGR